jgi:hypothetical protein
LHGSLEELRARRDQIEPDAFLRIVLDEPPRPRLAHDVREEFPHAVDISLRTDHDERRRSVEQRDVHGSPQELFARYLDDHGAADDSLTRLFATLLEEEHATDAP